MTSPFIAARRKGYEEFVESYEESEENPSDLLRRSLGNKSLQDRLKIANYLLDHGADPREVSEGDKVNGLHVLFFEKEHDFVAEAPLLKRLLDGGADINQRSPKFGVPLKVLYENLNLADDDLAPFYDVIFAHPGIDFNVPVNKKGDRPRTLHDIAAANAWNKPEFTRRMLAYEAEHTREGSS